MRIAVVDIYRPNGSVHKDPVTIPLGLTGLGYDPVLVSTDPAVDKPFVLAGLPVRPLADFHPQNWAAAGFGAAIVISRFAPSLGPVLAAVRAAGIPLVIKGDTDGTLGHPVTPNYLRIRPPWVSLANLLRHAKWRAPVARWVRPRIAQIESADRVVVESPGAAGNVAQFLVYWRCAGSVEKVVFLPNQVSPTAMTRPVTGKPERLVAAAGRWEDLRYKGTDLMCHAVGMVAAVRPDVRFVIAGSGGNGVARRLSPSCRNAVEIVGELSFDALQVLFARARVLLVPSRVESFSLVTGEALCAGASVAVTPIEPLLWLSGGGEWGTVARDFSAPAIAAALIHEIDRWERGAHDPVTIASHWRNRIGPDVIANRWDVLLRDIAKSLPSA